MADQDFPLTDGMRSYLACFDLYLRAPAGSDQEANAAELKRLALEHLTVERHHDRLDGLVLDLLAGRPSASSNELGAELQEDPRVVGLALTRLHRRGLVVRSRSGGHRRWRATWDGMADAA